MNKYKASKITSQEINKQQDKIYGIEKSLKSVFPFNEEDTKQLFKFHYEKLKLNEKLDFKQIKIQRLQSNHLYYWQEFLNLIDILDNNQIIKPITCIKLLPYQKNDQFFAEDSLILVINTPSKKDDKYI